MNRKSPVLVTTLVLALLAAACGDDDGASPDPTTTTTSAPEETTTSVDPFTVPDEITVEYVEAVLTELEKINGDALRLAIASGVTPEVAELVASVYTDGLAESITNRMVDDATRNFEGFQRIPGDVEVEVVAIRSSSESCVFVDVEQDYSSVAAEAGGVVAVAIELLRDESPDVNRTGWSISRFQPEGEDLQGAGACSGP